MHPPHSSAGVDPTGACFRDRLQWNGWNQVMCRHGTLHVRTRFLRAVEKNVRNSSCIGLELQAFPTDCNSAQLSEQGLGPSRMRKNAATGAPPAHAEKER